MAETAEKKTTTRAKAAPKAEEPEMNIFQRINAISQEAGALAPESKGGVPFAFRGIDGTVAHLTPFLHKYGVFNTSNVISHLVTEREVGNRVVKTTQVEVEFEFFAPDGSSVKMTTPGLADDFADRSSAQAMSVAYRIALLQLFHLPTHSREPEETGQDVMDNRGAAGNPAPKAVATAQAKAQQAAASGESLLKLQTEAKALGRKLNKGPDDLNAMGTAIGDEMSAKDWFNDAGAMAELVKRLKAEDGN